MDPPALGGWYGADPAELLTELRQDARMGQLIKNGLPIFYHLDSLVRLGILKRVESTKGRYALNDALSSGLSLMNAILFDKNLREILEDHIAYIYILFCCIARLIHGALPREKPHQILALTTILFRIAIDISVNDLKGRGVLDRQCTGCLYPYRRLERDPRQPAHSIEELIGPDPIIPKDPNKMAAEDSQMESKSK